MPRLRVPLTSARAAACSRPHVRVMGFLALTGSATAVDASETYTDTAGDSGAGPDIVEITAGELRRNAQRQDRRGRTERL